MKPSGWNDYSKYFYVYDVLLHLTAGHFMNIAKMLLQEAVMNKICEFKYYWIVVMLKGRC